VTEREFAGRESFIGGRSSTGGGVRGLGRERGWGGAFLEEGFESEGTWKGKWGGKPLAVGGLTGGSYRGPKFRMRFILRTSVIRKGGDVLTDLDVAVEDDLKHVRGVLA